MNHLGSSLSRQNAITLLTPPPHVLCSDGQQVSLCPSEQQPHFFLQRPGCGPPLPVYVSTHHRVFHVGENTSVLCICRAKGQSNIVVSCCWVSFSSGSLMALVPRHGGCSRMLPGGAAGGSHDPKHWERCEV